MKQGQIIINVQGQKLAADLIDDAAKNFCGTDVRSTDSAVDASLTDKNSPPVGPSRSSEIPQDPQTEAQSPDTNYLDAIESRVNSAAAKYDQVERIATTVTRRNDAAKSLWTTVAGSLTQTFWALFGLFTGVPREVWFVVAVIAAALMLMYLYRQIALGKIREKSQVQASRFQVSGLNIGSS